MNITAMSSSSRPAVSRHPSGLPEMGIRDRKMYTCPGWDDPGGEDYWPHNDGDVIRVCPNCKRYFVLCCRHFSSSKPCHHYELLFTDGSCLNNGQQRAVSGIGLAYGVGEGQQWGIAVNDTIDAVPLRTSQRAELLAAEVGLGRLSHERLDTTGRLREHRERAEYVRNLVVATDSEYVAKGMTEWVPVWKVRTSSFDEWPCRCLSGDDDHRRTTGVLLQERCPRTSISS